MQTDDHQLLCELFRTCLYEPNKSRSTTVFQTFDAGQFLLSLQRTIKKICKDLTIIEH